MPTPMPDPKPHPLAGESFRDQYVRAIFLSSLSTDYAATAEKLVGEVRSREDPYRGGDAEVMLAVVAARNVVRIALAVQKTALLPGVMKDVIKQQISTFNTAHPHLGDARDVIEHVDRYIKSKGNKPKHWFDLTKRFSADQFTLRVGGDLDLDMVSLIDDATELARIVHQTVVLWFNVEQKLKPLDDIVHAFMSEGIRVSVEGNGDTATVTILGSFPVD